MTKQKNRSNEQQSRASLQMAEAVALGTMAGGLALGVAQAREAQTLTEDDPDVAAAAAANVDQSGKQDEKTQPPPDGDVPLVEVAPTKETVATPTVETDTDSDFPADDSSPPNEAPAAVAPTVEVQHIAADTPASEQLSGAIARLVNDVATDTSTQGSALPLAGQILESVAEIVSTLKPGLDVSALTSLGSALQTHIETALEPTQGLLEDLPETIGSTVHTALSGTGLSTDLALLPSSLMASVTEALGGTTLAGVSETIDFTGLPSFLLGDEGPAPDTGLLSNLFYTDGGSELATVPSLIGQSIDNLEIPELTQMATNSVADIAGAGIGLLSLSYTDLSPDGVHPASGGIGGLGLL